MAASSSAVAYLTATSPSAAAGCLAASKSVIWTSAVAQPHGTRMPLSSVPSRPPTCARAARLQKSLAASSSIAALSSRIDSRALRIRRIRSGLASLASSTRNALASQSYRIGRLAAETRSVFINQNTRISDVSDDVKQLNGQQRVDVSRLHVLLRNQHALARLGAAAFVKAKSVLGLAMRAQADAAQSESEANDARVVVGRAAQRIASLQRTHNENVAYILQIAHALLKTNSLVLLSACISSHKPHHVRSPAQQL